MANGTMQTKALRQQLREQLGAGIRQTEAMIQRYREAYPNFDQVDWPAVQQHVAQPGVGSLGDPVIQAAVLLAPGPQPQPQSQSQSQSQAMLGAGGP